MKKLVLAALVGVAFTGCVQNEEFAPKPQKEISFEVANKVHSTRANFAEDQTFGVYVWHNTGSAYTQMTTAAYATVGKSGSDWVPSPALYWPLEGTVDCQAFYPATIAPTMNGTNMNEMTIEYEVQNANPAKPIHDVMFADRAYRYTENASDPFSNGFDGIPTLFRHALAKLNFKVALDDQVNDANVTWSMVVNSIKINGVYSKGELNLTTTIPGGTAAGYVPWSGIWSNDGSTVVTKTWADDTLVIAEEATAVAYNPQTYYVLPQTLVAGQQTLTIDYTLTRVAPGMANDVTNYVKTLNFTSGTGVTEWAMNKNITYTITVSTKTDAILFAPKVEDWDPEDGNIAIQ